MDEHNSPQLDLELECRRAGIAKYRADRAFLESRGREGTLPPIAHLIRVYVTPLREGIIDAMRKAYREPGRWTLAVKALEHIDADVCALITLRHVFNTFSKTTSLQNCASGLGGAIEAELRLAAFEEQKPTVFRRLGEYLEGNPLAHDPKNPRYKKKFWAAMERKHQIIWQPWEAADKVRVGMWLIDLVVSHTAAVTITTLEERLALPGEKKKKTRRSPLKVVVPTKEFADWVMENHKSCEFLHPPNLPMIEPPRIFTNPYDGGYFLKGNRRLMLNRFRGDGPEISAETCPVVFKAVNVVSQTAHVVNDRVLDVVLHLWEHAGFVPGAAAKEDIPLPPAPQTEDKMELLKHRLWCKDVLWQNIADMGRRFETIAVLGIANRFRGRSIWFPQRLDFRGRMYSAPGYLNPQGCDLAKGLLLFAKKLPLGKSGLNWLRLHTANSFGFDKGTREEREQWCITHRKQIEAVARDPLTNTWWHEADSPVQFLAACFELAGATEDTLSSLCVRIDGSCNGLQHLAAAVLDEASGALVNLIPSERPADIYAAVAGKCKSILENRTWKQLPGSPAPHSLGSASSSSLQLEGPASSSPSTPSSLNSGAVTSSGRGRKKPAALAKKPPYRPGVEECSLWADLWMKYGVNRDLCKRPTMITPYNGTPRAIEKYIEEHTIKKFVSEGVQQPFGPKKTWAVRFMRDVMVQALDWILPRPRELMKYTRDLARAATKAGQPVCWVSPSGFPVRMAYLDSRQDRVKTRIGDAIVKLTVHQDVDRLDPYAQARSLAPNWTHSNDAAHLHITFAECDEAVPGISLDGVHDSYGTHACHCDVLAPKTRETFVRIYSVDQVERLHKSVQAVVPDLSLSMPAKGTLDIKGVLKNEYFFL